MSTTVESPVKSPADKGYKPHLAKGITLWYKSIAHNVINVIIPGKVDEEFSDELISAAKADPNISRGKPLHEGVIQLRLAKRTSCRFDRFFPSVLNSLIDEIDGRNRRGISPGSIPRETKKDKPPYVNRAALATH